jgi:hypothetical protein
MSSCISALTIPSMRTVRTTPPAPGSRPSCTSGKPTTALLSSTITRWWQARQISSPPPSAAPLIAATTGLPSSSSRRRTALPSRTIVATSSASSFVALIRSLRSPPAKNVFFADVMITPLMSSFSASRRSTVFAIEAA